LNNSPRRTGSEGLINVEYINQELTIENKQGVYQPFIQQEEPLKRELETFIDCIQQDKPQVVTGEDGLRALKICEEAIESAKQHRLIHNRT
jgi:UDP-N-acetylglucosamine 3-dehydrogenase